jgi:hypothetical protein
MNMEHNETDQLLGMKKSLEDRIAKHREVLKNNLEDKGPKLPDFQASLQPVRDLIQKLEQELEDVKRKLEDLS